MSVQIKAGDVVKLNSGGPAMTVEGLSDAGPVGLVSHAYVVWFNFHERCQGNFALTSLTRVDRPSGPHKRPSI